ELLTLVQTGKVRPLPILLFGRDYWKRVVNFEAMVEEGVIAPHDIDLIRWCEEADEAWDYVRDFYRENPVAPREQSAPPE
ncbi:MAG TPA: LOG family protein, partial [Sphingomicrobium sp.]